jgi:hypothetical protein
MIRGKKLLSRRKTNLHFFLVAHCLIFSHNQPVRLGGGDAHGRGGGGVHRKGGGMHLHPVHPPGYATAVDTSTWS